MSIPHTHSHRRCAVLLLGLLCAVAAGIARADESHAPPAPISTPTVTADAPLPPSLPGRPNDSRGGEPYSATRLQQRIDALRTAGADDCVADYEMHKAQAWLNFAKYAVANEVPAPVTRAALGHAAELLTVLETNGSPIMDTQELPQSHHERDDLWRSIGAVKSDGRLCGAPKMTAYCEVQLAWVGYEASDGGWRHVEPYVRIAEDYCLTARDAAPMPLPARVLARDTVIGVPGTPDTFLEPKPVELGSPEVVPVEKIDVSISVLFPHNRYGRRDIRAAGRRQLARLAAYLAKLPRDTRITVAVDVTGHADLTGNVPYNERLSGKRAQTVAAELRRQGVDAANLHVTAVGSAEPVVECRRSDSGPERARYLACLEPNRRVVIRLVDDYD